MKQLSIIVPTLNESDNVGPLTERIDTTVNGLVDDYEIIFVDDHSSDGTDVIVESLEKTYPVRLVSKKGARGKAFSLLQGFKEARYDTICMIDADQQYPPEAIGPMYELLTTNNVDIVLTERHEQKISPLRKLSSKVFNFVFTKMLFGFDYDSQSGLKIFKKRVVNTIHLNPTPWSFDLEFIVRSLEKNYKILSYRIPFDERAYGETKVRVLKLTYELSKASLKLRASSSQRKVRNGYRRSLEISNKVLSILVAPAIIFTLACLHPSGTVHALTIDTGKPLTSITDGILSPIFGGSSNNDKSDKSSTSKKSTDDDSKKLSKKTKSKDDTSDNTSSTGTKKTQKQTDSSSTQSGVNTQQPAKSSKNSDTSADEPTIKTNAELNNKSETASTKPRDMYADTPAKSPISNQTIGLVFTAMALAVTGIAVTYKYLRPKGK